MKRPRAAPVEIRDAGPEDVGAMMIIRRSVVENAISAARLDALGIDEASLRGRLRSSHSGHCAVVGERVIGFAMADLGRGSIWALFVLPEEEDRGAGKGLLEAALDRIWEEGHRRAILSTDPGTRASEFYRRNGWRASGRNGRGEIVFTLERPSPSSDETSASP